MLLVPNQLAAVNNHVRAVRDFLPRPVWLGWPRVRCRPFHAVVIQWLHSLPQIRIGYQQLRGIAHSDQNFHNVQIHPLQHLGGILGQRFAYPARTGLVRSELLELLFADAPIDALGEEGAHVLDVQNEADDAGCDLVRMADQILVTDEEHGNVLG